MRGFIILLVLTLFLVPKESSAQMVTVKEKPSFYLGKRSTVALNAGLQPTLAPMNPAKDQSTTRESILPFPIYANIKPELTYTFALNNKVAIYVRGGLNKSSRTSDQYDYITYYLEDSDYYVDLKEQGSPIMKGKSLGAGFTFFKRRKAAIAPIGNHFSLGFSMNDFNVTREGVYLQYNTDFGTTERVDLSSYTSKIKYYGLEMNFATNQPITRELFYQLGISTTFTTRLLSRFALDDSSLDIDPQLRIHDIDALALRDILVLKLGLGYVIF